MDGQSWGEFMFHIADCQSSWALSVGGERKREEKEEELKIEGERKLVLAHDSLARAKQAIHCKFISGQGARFACCSRSWEGRGRAGDG